MSRVSTNQTNKERTRPNTRNLDCPPNEAKNSRLKFPHGQNSTAESYCEGLTFILTLWPSNRVPASEAKRQFVSPIKRSNAGRNPPPNPADTTTVEIGLVTSPRCQKNIHRVNERNLSTRTLVGTLGPLVAQQLERLIFGGS